MVKTHEDYRIIEYKRVNGSSYYHIQYRNFLGIWCRLMVCCAIGDSTYIKTFNSMWEALGETNKLIGKQVVEKKIH